MTNEESNQDLPEREIIGSQDNEREFNFQLTRENVREYIRKTVDWDSIEISEEHRPIAKKTGLKIDVEATLDMAIEEIDGYSGRIICWDKNSGVLSSKDFVSVAEWELIKKLTDEIETAIAFVQRGHWLRFAHTTEVQS